MPAPEENKNTKSNAGGAPSKYKAIYAEQAYKLCLLGFTDKQLAAFFEVSEDTIYEWRKVHKQFADKVKAGKTMADAEVVAAMYKRAVGFSYDELTFEKIDGKMNLEVTPDELITTDAYKKKIVTKLVIPDTGAQMNWLKNRQRDLWKDKQSFEFDLEQFTDEQLEMIVNRILEKSQKHEQ
ncbi:MAG: hypothetical protein JWQ09_2982 [Segetibacter sp.]|nr:hypothetical protein [Segetibacter sp.]